MPRRLAQQRMTLSGLKWPFHASRAISAVAVLVYFVNIFLFYGNKNMSYLRIIFCAIVRSRIHCILLIHTDIYRSICNIGSFLH